MIKKRYFLSIITLITLMFYLSFLVSINTNLSKIISENKITANAVKMNGNVGICIHTNKTYDAVFTNPVNYQIINQTINDTVLFKQKSADEVYNVTFTARNIRTHQSWYLGEKYVGLNNSKAILPVDTLNLPDDNCVYEFQVDIFGNKSCYNKMHVDYISVNNINAPPQYHLYNGNLTTNFSKYKSWVAIPNATLEKPNVGIITWINSTLNFDSANLDSNIVFKDKDLSIKNDQLYCLRNQKIDVTFFNVSYFQPTLYQNGFDCVASNHCHLIKYNKTEHQITYQIDNFNGDYRVVENTKGIMYFWYNSSNISNISINEPIYFYANYTVSDNTTTYYLGTLPNVYCNISFSYKNQYNYTQPTEMIYDNKSNLYKYTLSFDPAGIYYVKAKCDATSYDLGSVVRVLKIYVKPRIPKISTWCDTNLNNTKGQKYIRYINQRVNFWINLTNKKTGSAIKDAKCNISFIDDHINKTINLSFNNITGLYITNYSFLTPGNRVYNASCSRLPDYGFVKTNGSVNITNRPPIYLGSVDPNMLIPDSKWPQGTVISPYHLNDYFIDPDGNKLKYSLELSPNHIFVKIDNTSEVTYIPENSFYGVSNIIFKASDGYGGYAYSQKIPLIVIKLPKQNPNGNNMNNNNPEGYNNQIGFQNKFGLNQNPTLILCKEKWVCSKWSKCYPSNIQTRICKDINHCNTTYDKPKQIQKCKYKPTCHDHIKNEGETGVDCGGPCPPCPSCHDGIKNEGETGVDCGGPCPPCPSCFDGIKNEGETGVDCGGPCPPCKNTIMPKIFRAKIQNNLVSVTSLATLSAIAVIIYLRYSQAIINALIKLWLIIFAFYLSKIRGKKRIEEEMNIKQYLIIRLSSLSKSIDKTSSDKILDEILKLTRLFYKSLFDMKYEFTEKDLEKSINKIPLSNSKKRIFKAYFDRINYATYSKEKVTKEQVQRWIEILSELTVMARDLLDYRVVEDNVKKLTKLNKNKTKQINRKLMVNLIKFIRHGQTYLKNNDLKSAIEINYIIEKTLSLIEKSKKINKKLNQIKEKRKEFLSKLREELQKYNEKKNEKNNNENGKN